MKCLWSSTVAKAAVVIGFLLVGAIIFTFPPDRYAFFPRCTFHLVTGLYCPGCGSTRAAHQLVHGNVMGALDYNAVFVMLFPFVVFAGLMRFLRGWSWLEHAKTGWAILVVLVCFAIIRNLPFQPFSLLAP